MMLLDGGVILTQTEARGLNHVERNPEAHFRQMLTDWITVAKEDLIQDWQQTLFDDDSVTELPATTDGKIDLILARSDYRTRLQRDAALPIPEATRQNFVGHFNGRTASGTTTTLFSSGIEIPDRDGNALLAYYQHINEALLGAILGKLNHGKKLMIVTYEPIIRADDSVSTMPATEEGLINMIVARADYRRRG